MKGTLAAILVLASLLWAACEQNVPTSPHSAPSTLEPRSGATVNVIQLPAFVDFTWEVPCLGENVEVEVQGPISRLIRTVVTPNGRLHRSILLDVSQVTITLDDEVWTAGPNASEIFSINEGGNGAGAFVHEATVIFRSADGRPALRLVHKIHFVSLPGGESQLDREEFEILCVGPAATSARLPVAEHGGRPVFATMTGPQEVPPGDPDGTGTARFTLNQGQGEICYEVTVSNIALPGTASHIHLGAAGVGAGLPVVFLDPPDLTGNASGCVAVDPMIVKAIRQNPSGYYVNVHNAEHPSGAVRGQLER